MPKITKTKVRAPQRIDKYVWIILAILAVFVYFFGLNLPFLGPDESRYAQVGREMLERGDWITPTLGVFNWFEKPALLYWLEIFSYKLFGVNEFAARFGPALFGLGTVASLWILGRKLAIEINERSDIGENSDTPLINSVSSVPSVANDLANWLALIAASTIGIIAFSHGASFDILITFPITAALVSFFIFDQSKDTSFQGKYLPLTLFYVFIGVALLAKGLIGIVFPFAIVGFFYLLSRRLPSRAFMFSLFWGTLMAAAIAAIWYWPMYQRHGYAFIDEFIIQHHFQRFTSNKYQHPQPFYFFLWVLPLMTLPWLPFFCASIWTSVRQLFRRVSASPRLPVSSSPLLLFSMSWLLVPLIFFSISGSKLPGYILPAVPATIILTAFYVFHLVENSRRWRIAVIFTAAAVFVAFIVLLSTVVPRVADTDTAKGLIQAAYDRGYSAEPVYSLHTISHNAEFYAAGRLLREPDGKQKKLYSPAEIVAEMQHVNVKTALVIVPIEYQKQLTDSDLVRTELLKNNGELAIALVTIN